MPGIPGLEIPVKYNMRHSVIKFFFHKKTLEFAFAFFYGNCFLLSFFFHVFHKNFKSICITYMSRNLILPYSIHFHVIAEHVYSKIRFIYKRETDFLYGNLMMRHIIVFCCLTLLQYFISRKFNLPSRSSMLLDFICRLNAKSSAIIWSKAF